MKLQNTKEQHDKAARDGKVLVCIGVDARPAKRFGALMYTGVISWEDAQKVIDLLTEVQRNTIEAKQPEESR